MNRRHRDTGRERERCRRRSVAV